MIKEKYSRNGKMQNYKFRQYFSLTPKGVMDVYPSSFFSTNIIRLTTYRSKYPWATTLYTGRPQGIAHTGIPSMVFFATIMNYESNRFFYHFFILKLKL